MCELNYVFDAQAHRERLATLYRLQKAQRTPRRLFGTMGGEYLVWPDGRILRVTDQPTTVPEVRRDS
jgi:hypothetical protein